MPHRIPWGSFPKLVSHTSLPELNANPDFAKGRAGDFDAARRIVRDCYNRTQYINPPSFVVPVIGSDATGGKWNSIPLAFAEAIARDSGAKVVTDIVRENVYVEATKAAVNRLFNQAEFTGPVAKGTYYIVDDVGNFGSTIANLRGYISAHGGTVVMASALAAGLFSATLAPDADILANLRHRYASQVALIEDTFTFPLECLTNREAYYIFGLPNLDSFRDPGATVTRLV